MRLCVQLRYRLADVSLFAIALFMLIQKRSNLTANKKNVQFYGKQEIYYKKMSIGNHPYLCHCFNEYNQNHFWPAIYLIDRENAHTGVI